jgi:hypothetical protein
VATGKTTDREEAVATKKRKTPATKGAKTIID